MNKREMINLIAEWLCNEFPVYTPQAADKRMRRDISLAYETRMHQRAERLYRPMAFRMDDEERKSAKKLLRNILNEL